MNAKRVLLCAATLAAVAACSSAPDEQIGPSGAAAGADLAAEGGAATGGSTFGLGEAGAVASSRLPAGVAPGSQEDLEYTAGDTVLFGFDSAVLNSAGETTLQGQAGWLEQHPELNVTIEGHADERGTREYNLALGERRAVAAKNYLTALGVDPNRVMTVSYGEERPTDPAQTDEAYARNRRAETVVNRLN